MNRYVLAFLILGLLLGGCAQVVEEQATLPAEEQVIPPVEELVTPPEAEATLEQPSDRTSLNLERTLSFSATSLPTYPGAPLPAQKDRWFTGSGLCSACHTFLQDEAGNDVSIDTYWRSTMMANAARDPYWLASVRSETLRSPQLKDAIEDKCATCHMGMARTTAANLASPTNIFEDGFLDLEHALQPLAGDGVSCTLCHQIMDQNLGLKEGFSGGFLIDLEAPEGERWVYGPLPVDDELVKMMVLSSGYTAVQSDHIKKAEMCATCHTLYTPYLDDDGNIAGEFPEQTIFLEWSNSLYADSMPCQNCHMPKADGKVRLSTMGGDPQEPFSKHAFVGGNAYVLTMLGMFGDENNLTASEAHITQTLERVFDQLQNRTASLSIERESVTLDALEFDVLVEIFTGHKFPSGFPSRRAWLEVAVVDGKGSAIFHSGVYTLDGRIVHNGNDEDPSGIEPHYTLIASEDQVQIYEAIMGDVNDLPTTTLLRGAGYLKDNRLLPKGFSLENAHADIKVVGHAASDDSFSPGSDRITYRIELNQASGPFTVQVRLLYQSIGHRWAENLKAVQGKEIETFVKYYESIANLPVVIASQTFRLGD